jgi:NhaP-type Na+/H+ or K+/H+ antiporter
VTGNQVLFGVGLIMVLAAAGSGVPAAGLSGKILPVTFLVIVITVALYGLTAVPVARRLGVTRPARVDLRRDADRKLPSSSAICAISATRCGRAGLPEAARAPAGGAPPDRPLQRQSYDRHSRQDDDVKDQL